METFRCPTCIGVLNDPRARRCGYCGQRMRRRRPRVLGDETRLGPRLPIDRWMLERLQTQANRRTRHTEMQPVAWHGKFNTSPLASPDFAPTASPIATPIDTPVEVAAPIQEPPAPPSAPPAPEASDAQMPPTVGALALALDVYSTPRELPFDDVAQKPMLESVPQEVEPDEYRPPVDHVAPLQREEPLALIDLGTRPMLRRAVPHDELEPDVRAIVDDLYDQARAELSGTDLTLFAPPAIVEPEPESVAPIEPIAAVEAGPVAVAPEPVIELPKRDPQPEPPVAKPVVERPRRARRGWVAAFVTDERDAKRVTD